MFLSQETRKKENKNKQKEENHEGQKSTKLKKKYMISEIIGFLYKNQQNW